MVKSEVYFNEYNIPMDKTIYFPLVSGLLQSYAQSIPDIRENYQFMPIIFMRDHQENIIKNYKNPSVAAFSVSMWNMNLSLEVARIVKKRFPACLIVFGGPHVPFYAEEFFKLYPFIDVTVRGEGEQTFADILMRFRESRDFSDISGISYRDPETGLCVRNSRERELPKDLDMYPSPYLGEVFDYLFDEYRDMNFQVIIETNRGCPYMCSYCFWGQGGLSKRFRFFSLERVRHIAEWCGKNRIVYVFCADSNFGIFKRDLEIAGYFVDTKVKYNGLPEKFRVCYAKNAEATVFEIGRLLHRHDMEKGITLSRQTNSPAASFNVGRKNINMEVYRNLQKKYNKENIPVYTELILGLPGETYESFRDGIEDILQTGIKNQLFVYFCQVYPNTELDDPGYRQKFQMSTLKVPLNEIHAAVRPDTMITEYEEIIVSTSSMSSGDWKKTAVLSWIMQLMHGLKLGFYILIYLVDRYKIRYTDILEFVMQQKSDETGLLKGEVVRLYNIAGAVLQGNPRAQIMPDFANIYWDVEEALYLRIVSEKGLFYREFFDIIVGLLDKNLIKYDMEEIKDVIKFQSALIPEYDPVGQREYNFTYNIPEYFDTFFSDERTPLLRKSQGMILKDIKDYKGDKKAFAMEVLVYGRKSNKMLYPFKWFDLQYVQAGS